MAIKEIIDHLPPREDLVRIARYLGSRRRRARTGLVVFGVAGMLIGAGLALLFAPSRGSELRSQIGDRVDEYFRSMKDVAANGHDRAEGV
jgi:hypothetical protein